MSKTRDRVSGMRRHTPFSWPAVLRQQNCQVHAFCVRTRYCFSKKVGIGIGVCIRPPSFVYRQAFPASKNLNQTLKFLILS
jgi:hypothetical protein